MGRTIFENLLAGSRDRRLYPVNPKRAAVLGRKASANISAVPEPVDLAVIATPAATVPGIIAECVAAGVCGAVIISAGFKECGADGAELEHQIRARRRGGCESSGRTAWA